MARLTDRLRARAAALGRPAPSVPTPLPRDRAVVVAGRLIETAQTAAVDLQAGSNLDELGRHLAAVVLVAWETATAAGLDLAPILAAALDPPEPPHAAPARAARKAR